MIDKIEFILNKISKANLKMLERDTGIPATRMYKWRDGKGKPKTSDVDILWNYFQKDIELSQESNIASDDKDNQREIDVNSKRGIESFSDMADINQSETGFKYPYANRPQNGLMQIIQNIESLQMMQNQQIELLKKHVFESIPKS